MTEKMWLNKIKSFLEDSTSNLNNIDTLLLDIRNINIRQLEMQSESVAQLMVLFTLMGSRWLYLIKNQNLYKGLMLLSVINSIKNIYVVIHESDEISHLKEQMDKKIEEINNEEDKNFLKKVLQNGNLKK